MNNMYMEQRLLNASEENPAHKALGCASCCDFKLVRCLHVDWECMLLNASEEKTQQKARGFASCCKFKLVSCLHLYRPQCFQFRSVMLPSCMRGQPQQPAAATTATTATACD